MSDLNPDTFSNNNDPDYQTQAYQRAKPLPSARHPPRPIAPRAEIVWLYKSLFVLHRPWDNPWWFITHGRRAGPGSRLIIHRCKCGSVAPLASLAGVKLVKQYTRRLVCGQCLGCNRIYWSMRRE